MVVFYDGYALSDHIPKHSENLGISHIEYKIITGTLRRVDMAAKFPQNLLNLLHPYQFVLKEGDIEKNRLDYRLMLLQVSCPEVIKSPSPASILSSLSESDVLSPQLLDLLLS